MQTVFRLASVMTREKHKKPKLRKDSQLLIRINGAQCDEFVAVCEELDTSRAREIRRFIRGLLEKHQDSK